MIPDHIMRWLAIRFGKKVEWTGPTVFGVGYAWCGKIWFPEEQPEWVRASGQKMVDCDK